MATDRPRGSCGWTSVALKEINRSLIRSFYTTTTPPCNIELLVPINYWECDLELQNLVPKDL